MTTENKEFKRLSFSCPHCEAFQSLDFENPKSDLTFNCAGCQKPIDLRRLNQEQADACPLCGCKDLHQHKDFNKKVGLAIFIIGAVFAPWTYYLSLLVALAIDAALFPFYPWMAVCYKCHTELRGWPKNPRLDRFNHEIAAHYEYRKES